MKCTNLKQNPNCEIDIFLTLIISYMPYFPGIQKMQHLLEGKHPDCIMIPLCKHYTENYMMEFCFKVFQKKET